MYGKNYAAESDGSDHTSSFTLFWIFYLLVLLSFGLQVVSRNELQNKSYGEHGAQPGLGALEIETRLPNFINKFLPIINQSHLVDHKIVSFC